MASSTCRQLFLSTPSARRATLPLNHTDMPRLISIHALREEGDIVFLELRPEITDFYPRPPRGGRRAALASSTCRQLFLSTPSARRATLPLNHTDMPRLISIHALREEGDPVVAVSTTAPENFYPRPPRGGRPLQDVAQYMCCQISIHALREEGDALCVEISRNIYISIHALREEGDGRHY